MGGHAVLLPRIVALSVFLCEIQYSPWRMDVHKKHETILSSFPEKSP